MAETSLFTKKKKQDLSLNARDQAVIEDHKQLMARLAHYPEDRQPTENLRQEVAGAFWGGEWFALDDNNKENRVQYVSPSLDNMKSARSDIRKWIIRDAKNNYRKVTIDLKKKYWSEGWTPIG
ncbi:MAG: hypothetical protein OXE77_03420 [Flavobacteriaceae bacterium]|nr:hypothetical protein [Flavobacteriaceae bacterium]MCY4266361.1 hypothetical protein [Flavobacteriaceae bacterium]